MAEDQAAGMPPAAETTILALGAGEAFRSLDGASHPGRHRVVA